MLDEHWLLTCPACGSQALLGGDKVYEEVSDSRSPEPGREVVIKEYAPAELLCPTCKLSLVGEEAIVAAGLEEVYVIEDEREIEYEEEYGND